MYIYIHIRKKKKTTKMNIKNKKENICPRAAPETGGADVRPGARALICVCVCIYIYIYIYNVIYIYMIIYNCI